MTQIKSRKNKKNPHYGFLVSWEPEQLKTASVKGETKFGDKSALASTRHGKKADYLAQAEVGSYVKKDLVRSLITISLILILELVIYLAWTKFM